jgi:uncharacterized protein
MKIVIAGGSGFIGESLVRRLLIRGDDVAVLTRDPARVRAGRPVEWDAKTQGAWTADVAQADAIVNLAGENIGEGRWTDARKQRVIDSRINATRALVEAVRTRGKKPVFINASAVGYYGLRGDEQLDESGEKGGGFLADLSARWEQEARAVQSHARLVILRFGVVLAGDGGALQKMALPFKLGAGGRVGSGQQWMSWVDRDDVVRMIEWALTRDEAHDIYNVTAPAPVRNEEFTKILGRVLRRPAIMPAPAFALRLAFGEMADEVLLGGQRVVPAHAVAEGFIFSYRDIESSLKHALAK